MIEAPAWLWALLPAAGFLVGVFGSFTGLGGAILLTPVLVHVFGLPYDTELPWCRHDNSLNGKWLWLKRPL